MQGLKRKILYASLFELIAVGLTTSLLVLGAGHDAGHAGVAAVVSSTVAFIWNLIFNHAFEAWEARQPKHGRGRGWKRRAAHALGFEGGLVVMLVPLFAWWLNISLWQALLLDIGLLLFFMVYTYIFSLTFDRLFGLPVSARG
ncbi:PACE efflux transporter [Duganella sp. FT50W]|uniref:PACE efflux transporter n=1 Tax=Duganella lactea TaxID=2692173 RepID=A0A6L8MJQ1_9BURK|nr:PACE efflux transporter [Duganella lactea]MYM82162.1 PACE efflux transporter [Duganella lactea]